MPSGVVSCKTTRAGTPCLRAIPERQVRRTLIYEVRIPGLFVTVGDDGGAGRSLRGHRASSCSLGLDDALASRASGRLFA
jgi:hypothetical protein